eukprot:1158132-Pelagomonas_calceolata.AAC.6
MSGLCSASYPALFTHLSLYTSKGTFHPGARTYTHAHTDMRTHTYTRAPPIREMGIEIVRPELNHHKGCMSKTAHQRAGTIGNLLSAMVV